VIGDPARDQAAGQIVPIANPLATAQAMQQLLTQPAAWQSARSAGIARVEAEYTEALMMARYQHLYEEVIDPNWAPAGTTAAASHLLSALETR
jgi:glycosyltransferase involved in cell wall biosynthesis